MQVFFKEVRVRPLFNQLTDHNEEGAGRHSSRHTDDGVDNKKNIQHEANGGATGKWKSSFYP